MSTNEEYIKYKIEKANEAIAVAKLLTLNKYFADALAKCYYAAFYAVSAALINKELNPKTHSGAKSLFHKEFIITGIIDKKFALMYDILLAKRFEADYEIFAFVDAEEVPNYINQVEIFIELIKKELKK